MGTINASPAPAGTMVIWYDATGQQHVIGPISSEFLAAQAASMVAPLSIAGPEMVRVNEIRRSLDGICFDGD